MKNEDERLREEQEKEENWSKNPKEKKNLKIANRFSSTYSVSSQINFFLFFLVFFSFIFSHKKQTHNFLFLCSTEKIQKPDFSI